MGPIITHNSPKKCVIHINHQFNGGRRLQNHPVDAQNAKPQRALISREELLFLNNIRGLPPTPLPGLCENVPGAVSSLEIVVL